MLLWQPFYKQTSFIYIHTHAPVTTSFQEATTQSKYLRQASFEMEADPFNVPDHSVQQSIRSHDYSNLDDIFDDQGLNEEWIDQQENASNNNSFKLDYSNSLKSGSVNNINSAGGTATSSLGFNFDTTKIEANDVKKTPMFMKIINAQKESEINPRARNLESLFLAPDGSAPLANGFATSDVSSQSHNDSDPIESSQVVSNESQSNTGANYSTASQQVVTSRPRGKPLSPMESSSGLSDENKHTRLETTPPVEEPAVSGGMVADPKPEQESAAARLVKGFAKNQSANGSAHLSSMGVSTDVGSGSGSGSGSISSKLLQELTENQSLTGPPSSHNLVSDADISKLKSIKPNIEDPSSTVSSPETPSASVVRNHSESPMKIFTRDKNTYTSSRFEFFLNHMGSAEQLKDSSSLKTRSARSRGNDKENQFQPNLETVADSSSHDTESPDNISVLADSLQNLSLNSPAKKKHISSEEDQEAQPNSRKVTHEDYKADASDLMSKLVKKRSSKIAYPVEEEEEDSTNISSEQSDVPDMREMSSRRPIQTETETDSTDSFEELKRRESFELDASESDRSIEATSVNTGTRRSRARSPSIPSPIRESVESKPAQQSFKPARLPPKPPIRKDAAISSPAKPKHPRLNQITPQEYALNPEKFSNYSGSNFGMEFDASHGMWRKNSLHSLASRQSSRSASIQQIPVSDKISTIKIDDISDLIDSGCETTPPGSPEVVKNGDSLIVSNRISSGANLTDKSLALAHSTLDSNAFSTFNATFNDSQSRSYSEEIYQDTSSYESSSSSVIVTNTGRRVSQMGARDSSKANRTVSFVSEYSSTSSDGSTNIRRRGEFSMLSNRDQVSFSQALGETIKIMPLDYDGNLSQIINLNIPPNTALTNTRWVGKQHPRLEILNAPDGNIRYLHELPSSVRELHLPNNAVDQDVNNLHRLENLEVLDLSNNKLTDCSFLRSLTHLRELNLSGNNIKSLRGLMGLRSLQKLNLDGNDISHEIDLSQTEWTQLTTLSLKNNKNLVVLSGLQADCKIRELCLDNCEKLVHIAGNCNHLLKLSINSCPELTQLDLHSFPQLRVLKCDNNPGLTKFKDGFIPMRLEAVSMTHQNKDFCGGVESMFTSFNEVQRLRIASTPILHLDFGNEFFLNLHLLDLSNCGLKNLPENFDERCVNLRVLNLSGNEIKDTSRLATIPKLASIDLRDNDINQKWFKVLLRTIRNLEHLTTIDTRGNPVCKKLYGESAEANEGIDKSRKKYRQFLVENSYGLDWLDGEPAPPKLNDQDFSLDAMNE